MVAREVAVGAQVLHVPRPVALGQGGLNQLWRGAVGLAKVVAVGRHRGRAIGAPDVASFAEPEALVAGTGTALRPVDRAWLSRGVPGIHVAVVVAWRWEGQPAVRGGPRHEGKDEEDERRGGHCWPTARLAAPLCPLSSLESSLITISVIKAVTNELARRWCCRCACAARCSGAFGWERILLTRSRAHQGAPLTPCWRYTG